MRTNKSLSIAQQRLLIAHIDGPQPAMVREYGVRAVLVDRGMLISCDKLGNQRQKHLSIHYTSTTESGRDMVSSILAEYAEALVRAGCLDAVPISLAPKYLPAFQTAPAEPGISELDETIA